ncbi:hypothetical protein F5878DRAFT_272075 [Lentinula raphanica]|uniref:Transmembrane protein n=1 Tax=Lentinula raphanica TaxID=153919 RepID=A0AA38UC72_9AGAR|nr:hypothetical protein F5878DRAFT_272075 [Lentinula raphanica]
MASMLFPSQGMQALSFLIHILGISVLTHCLSRRLAAEDWTSWSSLREMTWVRICILLIFLDSWLFLFASGMLTFGVGLESKEIVCALAIYLCVVFYATSKLLIYSFLVEKVYLVWSPSTASPQRFRSPIYLSCLTMIAIYGGVIASMFAGKIHYFREGDGVCIIGLKQYSSLTLVVYDLILNIVLTLLFLWPVFKVNLMNPRLKAVATRTLLASAVALTTSTVNMLVLTLLKGHESGWVCLGSCGADVIFNALAVFWVTKRRGQSYNYPSSIGQVANNPGRESRRLPDTKPHGDNGNDLVLSSPPPTPWQAPTFNIEASPQTPGVIGSTPTSPEIRKPNYSLAFTSSPRDSRFTEDIEMRPAQKSSLFRSMTGLFRHNERHPTEHALQVTVTTIITDDIEAGNDGKLSNEESSSQV